MDGVLNLCATLGVAGLSLIGIVIQTKSKEKQENISTKLDIFREESKTEDKKILAKIDKVQLSSLKNWLVTEMTKIEEKLYTPNEEQKYLIHEAKKEYNKLGGDSYVDDMFDRLREKGLL